MRRRNAMVAAPLLVAVATAHVAGPARGADDADPIEIDLGDARILALSPDGQALAARAPSGLCVYDVVTLEERACGDLDAHMVTLADDSVVWSPDSTAIAFAEDAFRTLRDGDLWIMDASTGELTNVTDDGLDGAILPLNSDDAPPEAPIYVDVAPSWAPDGRTIAFSRSSVIGGEFDGNEIARLDVDGGEVETLAKVTSEAPGCRHVRTRVVARR